MCGELLISLCYRHRDNAGGGRGPANQSVTMMHGKTEFCTAEVTASIWHITTHSQGDHQPGKSGSVGKTETEWGTAGKMPITGNKDFCGRLWALHIVAGFEWCGNEVPGEPVILSGHPL